MASPDAVETDLVVNGVPGTVHMVDLEGTIRAKHANGGKSDVVLVPVPSNDPDDPLNWSPRRKLLSTICVTAYTIVIGINSAALYSVLVPVSISTGLSVNGLVSGGGYMLLFFGWGCLFWQPLALQYGKRPVYLLTLLGSVAVLVWTPYTTSQGQWYANKILQGFFGAPVESLAEISVSDVYFQHQRGFYLAIYGLALAASSSFGAFIAGFIYQGQDWKWVFYWCGIFCAIAFVICFFFMEETNYDRDLSTVATVNTVAASQTEMPEEDSTSADPEKVGHATPTASDSADGIITLSKKSYWSKLKLLDKPRPNRLLHMLVMPLKFFQFPVVVFAGFSYGASLTFNNLINNTTSLILSKPPYNFSSSDVGLTYIASIVGCFFGSAYAGWIGDFVVLFIARRSKGIVEAENRLWLYLLSVVFLPCFLILWGVGAAHGIPAGGLIFASLCVNLANTASISITTAYCIDSYKALSSDAMVTLILVRNTLWFAISYGVTPWVTHMGLQNMFIVAAMASLVQCLSPLVMVKYGPAIRNWNKDKYWRWVAENERLGITH